MITSYNGSFECETSGLLQHRDSMWMRYNDAAYTLTRRVDPTFNQLGLLTGFGYGKAGSLYTQIPAEWSVPSTGEYNPWQNSCGAVR